MDKKPIDYFNIVILLVLFQKLMLKMDIYILSQQKLCIISVTSRIQRDK